MQYKEVILPAIANKEQKFVSVEVGDQKNHLGISMVLMDLRMENRIPA